MSKSLSLFLKLGFYLSFILGSPALAIDYRNTFESLVHSSYAEILENSINPGNRILNLPRQMGSIDFRNSFEVITPETKWVLRPRWTLIDSTLVLKQPDQYQNSWQGKLDLTAGYVDWDINDQWKTVLGLQVYQWGPGEFMSPSNVFFKFSSDQKSFFYLRKGQVLARVNWTPVGNINVVLIDQPVSNNEGPNFGEKHYEHKAAVKAEYGFNDGSSLGAILGTEKTDELYWAEYFTWYLMDGLSLYADLQHKQAKSVFDPVKDGTGSIQIIETDSETAQLFTSANWGLRWEGRVDLRAEWYYNGLAWGQEGLKAVIQGLKFPNPYLIQNWYAFEHSGHELPGQSYFYLSLRIPDLGKKKDSNIYLRNVFSSQDSSGIFYLSGDKALGDSWTGYLEMMSSYGDELSEMKLLYGFQVGAGLRFAL